jgi:hypothetical protein
VAPSKRQTTMAKLAREQAVREKRARKQEKKDDRKAAALLGEQPLDETAEVAGPDDAGPEAATAEAD